jgi:hypothetical protein
MHIGQAEWMDLWMLAAARAPRARRHLRAPPPADADAACSPHTRARRWQGQRNGAEGEMGRDGRKVLGDWPRVNQGSTRSATYDAAPLASAPRARMARDRIGLCSSICWISDKRKNSWA